jgi:hypothetical protein
MRPFGTAGFTLMLLAGCATAHEEHGPPTIPYDCVPGGRVLATYEGGGWFVRARAHLLYGGRRIELKASPPAFGLRYVSADDAADPIMIWAVHGETASLAELPSDGADQGAEREIAACTRARGSGEVAPASEEPAHH